MTATLHPLRRRITVVIVGIVAGALIVTALGTLLLLRAQARRDTRHDLIHLAGNVARSAQAIQQPNRLTTFRALLRRTQDLVIVSIPRGVGDRLPSGAPPDILAPARMVDGQPVSGFNSRFAYAAVPFRALDGKRYAAVVTQPAGKASGAAIYFLLASSVALLVAAAAAAALSRRITHPLTQAEEATRQMASGDLNARVPISLRASAEMASLAESINSMAANLSRMRGNERLFLMSVSHDLRTPLTSIRGFAEALADGTATDTTRAANVIAAEARRLERLVGDLLDMAKLDANHFSLNVSPVDIVEVVEDTAGGFVPSAREFGLTVVMHDPITIDGNGNPLPFSGAVPKALADPDRLAQAVANLIENALKYARRTIDVTTCFSPVVGDGPGGAQIIVDDDGRGIPPEDIPHVFERLWTGTGDSGRQVGSGLGLAIVADLVAAMGGTIGAQSPVPRAEPSTVGPGTRISVKLRSS